MRGRMLGKTTISLIALALAGRVAPTIAEDAPMREVEVVISIPEQRLLVLRDGMWVSKYRVSTSKFGLGDSFGSYKTPVGKLRVCEKIGENFAPGAVIKHRHATGEILPINAPGRDPIVTRVLWLEGREERNKNSKSRGIYIHGTVEESKIGSPVSYGCIRMRSREVTNVFDVVPIGAPVTIQTARLGSYRRWRPSELPAVGEKLPTTPEGPSLPNVTIADEGGFPGASAKPAGEPRVKGKRTSENAPSSRSARTATRTPVDEPSTSKSVESKDREGGSAGSLKGSILFADMPTHTGKPVASATLESIRGPVLAPVAESTQEDAEPLTEPAPPLPRVIFRTGPSSSTIQERATR